MRVLRVADGSEPVSEAGAALDSWLGRVHDANLDRIVGIDRAIAEEWGRMNVTDDIARSGVSLVSPFDPAADQD